MHVCTIMTSTWGELSLLQAGMAFGGGCEPRARTIVAWAVDNGNAESASGARWHK